MWRIRATEAIGPSCHSSFFVIVFIKSPYLTTATFTMHYSSFFQPEFVYTSLSLCRVLEQPPTSHLSLEPSNRRPLIQRCRTRHIGWFIRYCGGWMDKNKILGLDSVRSQRILVTEKVKTMVNSASLCFEQISAMGLTYSFYGRNGGGCWFGCRRGLFALP
jgi:hypothetical protein